MGGSLDPPAIEPLSPWYYESCLLLGRYFHSSFRVQRTEVFQKWCGREERQRWPSDTSHYQTKSSSSLLSFCLHLSNFAKGCRLLLKVSMLSASLRVAFSGKWQLIFVFLLRLKKGMPFFNQYFAWEDQDGVEDVHCMAFQKISPLYSNLKKKKRKFKIWLYFSRCISWKFRLYWDFSILKAEQGQTKLPLLFLSLLWDFVLERRPMR